MEAIRFPGAQVTDGCKVPNKDAGSSAQVASGLNGGAMALVPKMDF